MIGEIKIELTKKCISEKSGPEKETLFHWETNFRLKKKNPKVTKVK